MRTSETPNQDQVLAIIYKKSDTETYRLVTQKLPHKIIANIIEPGKYEANVVESKTSDEILQYVSKIEEYFDGVKNFIGRMRSPFKGDLASINSSSSPTLPDEESEKLFVDFIKAKIKELKCAAEFHQQLEQMGTDIKQLTAELRDESMVMLDAQRRGFQVGTFDANGTDGDMPPLPGP